ncbi:MAG: [FeFe] hydrogenase H-cluster radical SAM maturase HydE [Porphyromonadaceae bacterium]|nr:[FeFe] hydrogenase H-cluster radical SAM maturase HydE [Porphyromonadaceae bacterium]
MSEILQKSSLSKEDIITLLSFTDNEQQKLCNHAANIKQQQTGNIVWLRGLIELSNLCEKNCYYCGIRCSNKKVVRYSLTHDEVMLAVMQAYKKGYGSVAIQSGEITSKSFTDNINKIVADSKKMTHGEIGITLSCGEQSEETYRRWFESGADRYLLRIETSSEALYGKLHPSNEQHSYAKRVNALESLRKTGYQVGTGVMIGLPFQTKEMLADDLLFMKQFDIDMCGMGPYIEHTDTPLYAIREQLPPLTERLNLSLKMISLLRILMPDINIAATTALQAIQKEGRELAILAGANVLMPNITPKKYRDDYFLYNNKPVSARSDDDELAALEQGLRAIDHEIGFFRQGNSLHFHPLST